MKEINLLCQSDFHLKVPFSLLCTDEHAYAESVHSIIRQCNISQMGGNVFDAGESYKANSSRSLNHLHSFSFDG